MRCVACERTVVPGYDGAAMGGGACYHIMCRECRDHYPNCPECGHKLVPEVPLNKDAYLDSVVVTYMVRSGIKTFEAAEAAIKREWPHVDGLPATPLFKLFTKPTWPQFVERCKTMHMARETAMAKAKSALRNYLVVVPAAAGEKRPRTDDGAAAAAAPAETAFLELAANKPKVVVGSTTIQVAAYNTGCKKCRFRPTVGVHSVCKTTQGWLCVKCAFGVPETVENLKKILSGAPFKAPVQQRKAAAGVTTAPKKVPLPKGLELDF